MSFNRTKYDKCEYEQYNRETVGPGMYYNSTPVICDNCFNENPRIINQKTGVSMSKDKDWRFYNGPVDIESDLFNLTRRATKCNQKKYNPNTKCNINHQGIPSGSGVVEEVLGNNVKSWQTCNDSNLHNFSNCYFPTEDTRLSNPPCTLRGIGINRFDPLLLNPQDQITFPGNYQIPTRLVFKDNHRPCVPKPAVNDMNPPVHKVDCKKTTPTCVTPTKPLYQYDVCG